MHRRPAGKPHAGLWEFPGGKVELSEIPVKALIRELSEELGIEIETGACIPSCFAESRPQSGEPGIVILLYKVERWTGEPQALEGGEIAWYTPEKIAKLAKPPLDESLAANLFGRT